MDQTGRTQNKKQYWENFYNKKHILEPSDFCKYIVSNYYLPDKVFDLCCGNGRDAYHLGKYAKSVTGVDYASKNEDINNISFIKSDLRDFLHSIPSGSFYCRFGLHAIEEDLEDLILDKGDSLYLEFRSDKDKDFLDDHYRRLINGNNFLTKLIHKNFEIKYFIESKNLAVYKQFDPHIIRVICSRSRP